MSNCIPKEYQEVSNENGMQEFNVEGWKGFYQLILEEFKLDEKNDHNKLYINDYIWRGDKSEKKLKSTYDKSHQRNNLRRHKNSFAYASRGKLEKFGLPVRDIKGRIKSGNWNENHFWALGQHYGLKTPLLDWTMSPFVAAYFAFGEENTLEEVKWDEIELEKIKSKNAEVIIKRAEKEGPYKDRVVWGLKYKEMHEKLPMVKEIYKNSHIRDVDKRPTYHFRKIEKKELRHEHGRDKYRKEREHFRQSDMDHIFEYFDPMSSEHERLIDQRGLFTITGKGEDIIVIVKKHWTKAKYKNPWLIKIKIKSTSEIREDFLRGLNVMNINNMTLFREVEGAAKFCNDGLDFEGYSVFPGQGE